MGGYSDLAGSLAYALRLVANHIEKKQREGRHDRFQQEWSSIESDPIGWLGSHFSMSKPLPTTANETSTAKPKPRSIKFDRADAEKLSKYILQLEYGYEQL